MSNIPEVQLNDNGSTGIRMLMVEEDPEWQKLAMGFIARIPGSELVAQVNHHEYAIPILSHKKIDVLIIDMDHLDKLRSALLERLERPPVVILTTANADHAIDGFEYGATDLLLKPCTFERFKLAIERAQAAIGRSPNKTRKDPLQQAVIAIRSHRRSIFLSTETIRMIEANGNLVKIHLNDKEIVANCTMKQIASLLPARTFTRVHRSYIVADRIVVDLDRTTLYTTIGEIPIGAAFRRSVQHTFQTLVNTADRITSK